MANFFKEYHAELKKKREEVVKEKTIEYKRGQVVHINPMYDEDRNGKRYFADQLGDDSVLLAKTKKEAMSGYGRIYSVHVII